MTGDGWFVCALLVVTVALFVSDRLRLDVVALLVILALAVSGVLTPREAVAGFGDTVVVLIAGLFVVGEALARTGVAAAIGAWLVRSARGGPAALQVRLMLVVAVLSAFMSSTGAVAVFIPVAAGIARRTGVPIARLLIPIAFASLLGGTLTLIGTPPNIVVDGALRDAGLPGFDFHSFTPAGLVLLAGGIAFLVTVGGRLLPRGDAEDPGVVGDPGSGELLESYGLRDRVAILRVEPGSDVAGRTLAESGLRAGTGYTAAAVQRPGRLRDDVQVAAGDTLVRAGDVIVALAPADGGREDALRERGLTPLDEQAVSRSLEQVVGLVEVVVPPRSAFRGKTIRELAFRRRRRLQVLGLQHDGENVAQGLADHAFATGDTALLSGAWRDIDALRRRTRDVLVLARAREWRDVAPTFRRAPWALGILALMLVALVANWLPALTTVLLAAVALVVTGCLTMPDAYRAINWQSLVLIAGMLPMSTALAKTGALGVMVDGLVGALGGTGPFGVMTVLFVVTAVASQVISNTATAVLLAPVAIGVADGMGISPRPLVMAVALAASAAFVTPVASPVNTLVLGPGGYRFADFVKVGLPLLLLCMVLVLVVVPLLFPF